MPNFLERALPTIGSIGGGILGGLGAGAADVASLGAAAPLVNPITGAIAGSAAGEAAGKAGQNLLEGQNAGQGVLGAGVEGAVSQAAGEGIGKVAGIGGKALLNTAAGKSAQQGVQQSADQLAQAAHATDLFNKVFPGFENSTKPVQDLLDSHGVNTDLTGSGMNISDDANNLRTQANILPNAIASPIQNIRDEEVLKAAGSNKVTLPSDIFQKLLTNVDSVPGITGQQHIYDTAAEEATDEEKAAEAAMPGSTGRPTFNTSGKNPVVNYADQVVTDIGNAIKSKGPSGEEGLKIADNGQVSGSVSMEHALNILRQISKTADKHYAALTNNNNVPLNPVEKTELARMTGDTEKELQDFIYNQPGVADAIKARAGDAETATRGMMENAEGGSFDPVSIEKAVQTQKDILNQPSVTEMNSQLSPLIGVARTARGASSVAANSGPAEKSLLQTAAGGTKKQATSMVDTVNPLKSAKAATVEGLGLSALHPAFGVPLLAMGAAQGARNLPPAVLSGAGNALTSLGTQTGMGALGGLASGGAALATQGGAPAGAPMPTNAGGTMQPTAATQGVAPATGAASPNPFLSLIPGSGVSAAYQPIAQNEMVSMFDPSLLGQTQAGANTAAQGISDKQQALQQTMSLVNSLKGEYQQAGGGQGALGGILSQLQGKTTGGPARAYQGEAATAASSIATATGANPAEVKQYIPQLTDTPEVAQTKLNALSQLIQSTGFTATPTPGQSPANSTLGSLSPAS